MKNRSILFYGFLLICLSSSALKDGLHEVEIEIPSSLPAISALITSESTAQVLAESLNKLGKELEYLKNSYQLQQGMQQDNIRSEYLEKLTVYGLLLGYKQCTQNYEQLKDKVHARSIHYIPQTERSHGNGGTGPSPSRNGGAGPQ